MLTDVSRQRASISCNASYLAYLANIDRYLPYGVLQRTAACIDFTQSDLVSMPHVTNMSIFLPLISRLQTRACFGPVQPPPQVTVVKSVCCWRAKAKATRVCC